MVKLHRHEGWATLLGFGVGLLVLAAPGTARATDIGVGLMGAVGGNFQDKPNRTATDPDLNPGFGGLTAGGGLMVDGRILDLLGVEVDVLRTSDKGKGTINFPIGSYKVTIGQSAWHVPILAKITIPSPIVAPMFFIGPELVFPSNGTATVDGPTAVAQSLHAKADHYVMVTVGGGVEIKLPLPVLDIRIPIGLRLSYNPSLPSSYSDRTKTTPDSITYDSAWKFAVSATAGAAIYF